MWVGFWGHEDPENTMGWDEGLGYLPAFLLCFDFNSGTGLASPLGFVFMQIISLCGFLTLWKGISYSDNLIIVIPWFLPNCLSLGFWLHTFGPAVGCVYVCVWVCVCVCVCVCIKCETKYSFLDDYLVFSLSVKKRSPFSQLSEIC